MKRTVLAAVIGASGIIIASLIPIYCSNSKKTLDNTKIIAGMISEEGSNKPIGQAQITIVGRNEFDITQDNGNFRISIDSDKVNAVRLKITKKGYKTVDLSFDLPDENVQIQMVREN